jgi:hypothetical protein
MRDFPIRVTDGQQVACDTDIAIAAGADFRLLPFSPLIDGGTNLLPLDEDIDGEPRPFDGDGDGLARFDIGADEYHPWLLHQYTFPVAMRQ